jgi:hypothetical protein
MNNNLTWFGRTALASLVIASITASNIDKNDINYAHVAVPEFIIVANLIIGLILIGIIFKDRQNTFTLVIKWLWILGTIGVIIFRVEFLVEYNIRDRNLVGDSLIIISASLTILLDIIAVYFLMYKEDDKNQELPIVYSEYQWLTYLPLSGLILGLIFGKYIYPSEEYVSGIQYIVGSGILFLIIGYFLKILIKHYINTMPNKTSLSECPECLELIKIGAKKCRYCGSKLN